MPVIGKADNVADISFNGRLLNHQVAQLMALYFSQSDMTAALGKFPPCCRIGGISRRVRNADGREPAG